MGYFRSKLRLAIQLCLTVLFAFFINILESTAANREIGFKGRVVSAGQGHKTAGINRSLVVFADDAAVKMHVANHKRRRQPYRFNIRDEITGRVITTATFSVHKGEQLTKIVTFPIGQPAGGGVQICGERLDRRGKWRQDKCQRLMIRRAGLN